MWVLWAGVILVTMSLLRASCIVVGGSGLGLIGWVGILVGIKLSNGVRLWSLSVVKREEIGARVVYRK